MALSQILHTDTMTTGIIIGRFQVPDLTLGHKALIVKAYETFDNVGFLLGAPPEGHNVDNPLSFQMRQHLLTEWEPLFVEYLVDVPGDNAAWSRSVDKTIMDIAVTKRLGAVTLVGGRKSFVPCYSGQFKTVELPIWIGKTGTQHRAAVVNGLPIDSSDFRKGVIWAVGNYEKS